MVHLRDVPLAIWGQIKASKPFFISKSPHFNFITAHCKLASMPALIHLILTTKLDFWILGLTLSASVLIFAIGNTAGVVYIDCLFFASGANTQAGLNTVDVATLSTFQQVIIYLCAGLANPITVNSMVVFLRLYWFQKRFQNVVREAKKSRVSIAESRSKIRPTDDSAVLEQGVDPNSIRVVHDGKKRRIANDGILLSDRATTSKPRRNSSSDETLEDVTNGKRDALPAHLRHPTTITFADTVKRSDGVEDKAINLPIKRSDEDHIAILQRQRNPQDKEVLRIPNPRDVERGMKPKIVSEGDGPDPDDDEEEDVQGRGGAGMDSTGRKSEAGSSARSRGGEQKSSQEKRRQTITFTEPERRKRDDLRDSTAVITNTILSPLRLRKNRVKPKPPGEKGKGGIHLSQKNTINALKTALSSNKVEEEAPYLSWHPTMARNSQFVGLSEEQRDELGGIEYRSLKTLALILIIYFWGFELLSLTFLLPFILHNDRYGRAVEGWGVNRTWWGFFTAHSAFQDLGFTLTPDSMASFQTSRYVLLVMSFFIIIGNTGFPIMLRVMIWLSSKVVPSGSGLWEELRFLLDHPRRCFTLMFPSKATWWLFWVLVILNATDIFFFIVLDLPGHTLDFMPVSLRFLNAWFVATCTRTAGFSSISISLLHPAVQVSYMIMMYISIFPIAISIRRTNVYEEQSLGMYGDDNVPDTGDGEPSYVGAHLRRQLSFDLWFLFLCYFLLAISEGGRLKSNDPDFNMFSLLFECVSAYGTVGLSIGYPNFNTSFCGQFSTVGKLLIIALQIRGRHRGLPYGLDKAILLPSESLNKKEDLVGDDGTGLTHTMSYATGFQSFQRARTRSMERQNTSLLSRVMQPGPTVVHTHIDTLTLNRTMSHHSTHQGGIKRSKAEPVNTEDESYEMARHSSRPTAKRSETLPTIRSFGGGRSNSSTSSIDELGVKAAATAHSTQEAHTPAAKVPLATPTLSTETTAVEELIIPPASRDLPEQGGAADRAAAKPIAITNEPPTTTSQAAAASNYTGEKAASVKSATSSKSVRSVKISQHQSDPTPGSLKSSPETGEGVTQKTPTFDSPPAVSSLATTSTVAVGPSVACKACHPIQSGPSRPEETNKMNTDPEKTPKEVPKKPPPASVEGVTATAAAIMAPVPSKQLNASAAASDTAHVRQTPTSPALENTARKDSRLS